MYKFRRHFFHKDVLRHFFLWPSLIQSSHLTVWKWFVRMQLLVLSDAVLLSETCILQTRVSASDGAVALMISTAALCSLHHSLLPGVEEEEEEEKTVCHRRVSAKEETVRKSAGASYTACSIFSWGRLPHCLVCSY